MHYEVLKQYAARFAAIVAEMEATDPDPERNLLRGVALAMTEALATIADCWATWSTSEAAIAAHLKARQAAEIAQMLDDEDHAAYEAALAAAAQSGSRDLVGDSVNLPPTRGPRSEPTPVEPESALADRDEPFDEALAWYGRNE
jgi:hypothetical protein